jgi:hypothetical protein
MPLPIMTASYSMSVGAALLLLLLSTAAGGALAAAVGGGGSKRRRRCARERRGFQSTVSAAGVSEPLHRGAP